MSVLVLAEELDPTADAVIDELNARAIPVFRADTAWFPSRLSLTAQLDDGHWRGVLVADDDKPVVLEDLRSAWFRRPAMFRFPPELSEPERRHAEWEAELGFGGVLAELPILWVNHPSLDAAVAYKPLQLATAARCGLVAPPTLITNRRDAVTRFARVHEGQLVIKNLVFWPPREKMAGDFPARTHRLTSKDLTDLDGISNNTHLFQRAILDKEFDARLTVVGHQVFAAAIGAESFAGRAGWRRESSSLRWTVIEAPTQVAEGVRAFMNVFGLAFAIFDFAVDAQGVWWFVEANSAGQFRYVEDTSGLPITCAVADLLEKGVR